MKKLFGGEQHPEQSAREAIRAKKWSVALAFYEARAVTQDRDYALWNLIGDLHMNNKARAQAVDAWRRAVEGYAMDGLHENVLGIARKMLRRTPEEEDAYLLMADAYIGLEYYADCLAQIRSYIKLAKHKSESDLRSAFKKVLESELRTPHLLEELQSLWQDSGIEDVELRSRITQFVETRLAERKEERTIVFEPEASATRDIDGKSPEKPLPTTSDSRDELISLHGDGVPEMPDPLANYNGRFEGMSSSNGLDFSASAKPAESEPLPAGDGKDHYDLGVVYREMKLWDAAIGEFEQARRDPSVRTRSTLALSECLQESGDLRGALDLLESEKKSNSGSPSERMGLDFQLGVINELLGNLEEALAQYQLVRSQNAAHEEAGQRIQSISRRLGRQADA